MGEYFTCKICGMNRVDREGYICDLCTIAALRQRVEELEKEIQAEQHRYDTNIKGLEKIFAGKDARISQLEEGLRFYGDEKKWWEIEHRDEYYWTFDVPTETKYSEYAKRNITEWVGNPWDKARSLLSHEPDVSTDLTNDTQDIREVE